MTFARRCTEGKGERIESWVKRERKWNSGCHHLRFFFSSSLHCALALASSILHRCFLFILKIFYCAPCQTHTEITLGLSSRRLYSHYIGLANSSPPFYIDLYRYIHVDSSCVRWCKRLEEGRERGENERKREGVSNKLTIVKWRE